MFTIAGGLVNCMSSPAQTTPPTQSKWVKKLPATNMENEQRQQIILPDASVSEPESFQIIEVVDIENLDLYSGKDELFRPYVAPADKPEPQQKPELNPEPETIETQIQRPIINDENLYLEYKTEYNFITDNDNVALPGYTIPTRAQLQAVRLEKPILNTDTVKISRHKASQNKSLQNHSKFLKHYVIQLLAVKSTDIIRRFVQRHQLPQNQLWVARTQSKGEEWIVLFYGDYTDSELAQRVAKTLKADYGLNEVWIRPLPNGITLDVL